MRQLDNRLRSPKSNLPIVFQGIKQGALHIDVRKLDHVIQLSPYSLKFGSGNTFGRILKFVSQDKYTMIHGQSLTVGVAGYLQGLGVNPMGTSQRYGFGSDHVLEYTMVLADGSIAKVNRDNTTILKPGLSRQRFVVSSVKSHHETDDDFYCLFRWAA